MKRTLALFLLICAVAQAQPAINGYDYTNNVFRAVSVDASGHLVLGGAISASVTVDLTSLNAAVASTTAEAHSLYLRSLTQSQGTVASPTNIVLGSETIGLIAAVSSTTTAVSSNQTGVSAAIATTTGVINALRNENNARAAGTTASPSCVIATQSRVISEARIPVSLASGTGQLVGTILTAWSVTLAEPQTVTIVCDIGNIWVGLATTTATSICASQGIKLSAGMSYSVDYGTGWTAGLVADTGETAQASATIVVSTRH